MTVFSHRQTTNGTIWRDDVFPSPAAQVAPRGSAAQGAKASSIPDLFHVRVFSAFYSQAWSSRRALEWWRKGNWKQTLVWWGWSTSLMSFSYFYSCCSCTSLNSLKGRFTKLVRLGRCNDNNKPPMTGNGLHQLSMVIWGILGMVYYCYTHMIMVSWVCRIFP